MELSDNLKAIGEILTIYQTLLDKLGFSGSEPYKDKIISDLITDLKNSKKYDKILKEVNSASSVKDIFSGYEKIQDLIKKLNESEKIFCEYESRSTIL